MRDLVMLGFLVLYVPLGLRNAFAGYLLWGWAGLMAVSTYLYGFMQGLPYAQIFALLTLTSLLLWRDQQTQPFSRNRTMVWMGIFLAHGLVAALLAYPGLERNWELFGNLAKTMLFCAFMPMLVTSRLRIHAMVIMLALAVSFHGALDGLKFIASAGGHNAQGIEKFGDNNQFALMLLMVIPLLIYLFRYSEKWFMRWGFGITALLTVLAVVATHSRGALVGLLALAVWIVVKGRHKVGGLVAIALATVLVTQLAPDNWSERMHTIQQADEDASFMGRVTAWKVSSAIALSNPVFGGGFRALQSDPVWTHFMDEPGLLGFVQTPRLNRTGVAAHSIWFEVMGDLGLVGFLLFVALLINALVTWRDILKLVRQQSPARNQWAGDLADLLAAVIFIYMICGSLLSAAYFEMPYIVMMLLEVIKLHLLREGTRTVRPPSPEP